MIRTKTTFVVGAGAAAELELPDAATLLARLTQAFDFQRLGTDLQTKEMQDFAALFGQIPGQRDKLLQAAQQLRTGSRLSGSVHALLEQYGDDQHLRAVGKLALGYFTLRAEEKSPIAAEPRDPGEMPLRGTENWLFQLGQLVVDGVPRAKAENCFDNLHIINFGCDRAIQHYLPWALEGGFGMSLTEARQLCAEKLRVVQPYGRVGKLEWQAGEEADTDWGDESRAKIFPAAECLRTAGQFLEDRQARAALQSGLTASRRLVFLGYDFNAFDTALLIDDRLSQTPLVLAALRDSEYDQSAIVRRLLNNVAGIPADSIFATEVKHSWKLLRDYRNLIES